MSDPIDPPAPDPKPLADTPPPRTFTQAEMDVIIQKRVRELSPAAKERDALAAKLAEIEEARKAEEEAKLTKTQREQRDLEREREGYKKTIAETTATAARERTLRHDADRARTASSLVAGVATRFLNERLVKTAERDLLSRLVVEADDTGKERVMVRMSDAAADLEPVETAWPKLLEQEIAPTYFKAQGGAGSQHGTGAGGNGAAWKNLPPEERIKAGLGGQRG